MKQSTPLSTLPSGLRKPLLAEYTNIVRSYSERRWTPAELSGGRLCEVVYTVLDGYAAGKYLSKPSKPNNFVAACRKLENNGHVPRSFRILIPRLLPALYEVRNNRGVGHVGGDVDPNQMDSMFVISSANWIMCELVRVFHSLPIDQAQLFVDKLAEIRVPLVWKSDDVRRVLHPKMTQKQQILLLLASASEVSVNDLSVWLEVANRSYFFKTLRSMHKQRLIELNEDKGTIVVLPPGAKLTEDLIRKFVTF